MTVEIEKKTEKVVSDATRFDELLRIAREEMKSDPCRGCQTLRQTGKCMAPLCATFSNKVNIGWSST